jgi:hypothetical protein
MSKGFSRSLGRGSASSQPVCRETLTLRDKAITTSGLTGIGFGTAVLAGLPQGNILILGAIAYLQFTKQSAGTIATFDGDVAIGSAPTADNALAGAEVDIIPSTPLNAATAGVSPMVRGANATQVMLDNTDGSLELNLNLLLDDASVSADAQAFVVNGTVQLAYIVLGDD